MRFIYILIAVVVVSGGVYLFSRTAGGMRESSQNQMIETAPVVRRELIRQTVRAVGEVSAAAATEIKSEFTGRIAVLHVEDGDVVERSQLLVELDRSEIESQEEELLRGMRSTQLRLEKAERDYERMQGLHEKGFVTEKSYDDARTEWELARNQLEIDEARLQTLREKLAKSTIRAPHDGMVLDCDLREGQIVSGADSVAAGTLLMHIADIDHLLVKTDINEVDVTQMERGMSVQLTFDAIPGLDLEGILQRVSPSARMRDRIRVFPLEIGCQAGDPRLKPGISANAIFTLGTATNALGLVASAVFGGGDEHHVFVREANGWRRQTVVIGVNDAQYVEIVEGLREGDEVALMRPPEFVGERAERNDEQRRRGRGGWH